MAMDPITVSLPRSHSEDIIKIVDTFQRDVSPVYAFQIHIKPLYDTLIIWDRSDLLSRILRRNTTVFFLYRDPETYRWNTCCLDGGTRVQLYSYPLNVLTMNSFGRFRMSHRTSEEAIRWMIARIPLMLEMIFVDSYRIRDRDLSALYPSIRAKIAMMGYRLTIDFITCIKTHTHMGYSYINVMYPTSCIPLWKTYVPYSIFLATVEQLHTHVKETYEDRCDPSAWWKQIESLLYPLPKERET